MNSYSMQTCVLAQLVDKIHGIISSKYRKKFYGGAPESRSSAMDGRWKQGASRNVDVLTSDNLSYVNFSAILHEL